KAGGWRKSRPIFFSIQGPSSTRWLFRSRTITLERPSCTSFAATAARYETARNLLYPAKARQSLKEARIVAENDLPEAAGRASCQRLRPFWAHDNRRHADHCPAHVA